MILVMAEEFKSLPQYLQKISSTLIDNRKSRTAVICGVIVLMSLTSSISLIDIEGHSPEDIKPLILKKSLISNPMNDTELLNSNNNNINNDSNINRPLPIILNLSLKTNINNSIIINVNNHDNKSQCGGKCLNELIGNFNGIVKDAENITKLANETSSILNDLNRKLTHLQQGEYIFAIF